MSTQRIREIPYNYTSFSDREIILRLLGADGQLDQVVGAAYRAFGDAKALRRKGTGGKATAFKTASGLRY